MPKKKDVMILILGSAGTGKSTLINNILGRNVMKVSDNRSLTPQTMEPKDFYASSDLVELLNLGVRQLILVDTPGFDSPLDATFRRTTKWLKGRSNKFLTGCIYLHDISVDRVPLDIFSNIKLLFSEGKTDLSGPVVAATSKWEKLESTNNKGLGESREQELIDNYWGKWLSLPEDSALPRLQNNTDSAQSLIKDVMSNDSIRKSWDLPPAYVRFSQSRQVTDLHNVCVELPLKSFTYQRRVRPGKRWIYIRLFWNAVVIESYFDTTSG